MLYMPAFEEGKPICPISFEPMTDPVATPCGHIFDMKSIWEAMGRKEECPTCHGPINNRKLDPVVFVDGTIKRADELAREVLPAPKPPAPKPMPKFDAVKKPTTPFDLQGFSFNGDVAGELFGKAMRPWGGFGLIKV